MTYRKLHLIDGIAVTKITFARRQIFGEHSEAHFRVVDVPSHKKTDLRRKISVRGEHQEYKSVEAL